jgi:mannose-6-phosphate isomerase-like protein (cupin superfamily)
MSGYTIVNFDDVHDSATSFGLSPDLDARFAKKQLECEKTGVSRQRIAPGFRVPFGHTHKTQEELYVVVHGGGFVKLDDEVRPVRRWDVVRVAPETARGFEAGPDGLELVAFGAPYADGDAETIQDWWA